MLAVNNADRIWSTVQGDDAHLDSSDVLPGLMLPLADVLDQDHEFASISDKA